MEEHLLNGNVVEHCDGLKRTFPVSVEDMLVAGF